MSELHFPWLEFSIALPILGALIVSRLNESFTARKWAAVISGITLISTIAAWEDLYLVHATEAADRWDLSSALLGRRLLTIDELSAPLLPMVALLFFLTCMATPRTKLRRFSFAWTLVAEAIALATLSCREPWPLITLLGLGILPPYRELRNRGRPSRVYVLHMLLFQSLLIIGWIGVEAEGSEQVHSLIALVPLLVAILIRSAVFPFHTWVLELAENNSFGTTLLFLTPLTCAYAAVRLVVPISPDWVLRAMGVMSLFTAVYTAGLALVQTDARRLFCYLFLSHSAIVLVGMEMATPIGLTGGLCVWLSTGLALTGFGLTLRALEARFGRLTLCQHLGYYEHTPTLAMCFLITGLASVGFPGTIGFVGTELLIDGAVGVYPSIGVMVVLASALNGIAVVRAYMLLFAGKPHESTISVRISTRERFAVLLLVFLILGGGLLPGPGVQSRHHAAVEILGGRAALWPNAEDEFDGGVNAEPHSPADRSHEH